MGRIREYRPIEFRQVCALARVTLLREPTMNDSEWKAAVKEIAAKQGWDNPPVDMLDRALNSVERALQETTGPRPTVDPPHSTGAKPPENKGLTDSEWKAFARTLQYAVERTANTMPANIAPLARETLTLSEPAALDQFYAEAHDGDRIAALRRFAEIAIVREADWDPQAIRDASQDHPLHARACYACRVGRQTLVWHHIIQIQHGGSNYLRNRVALCAACHHDVHPWLPKSARIQPGWSSLAELIPLAFAVLEKDWKDSA